MSTAFASVAILAVSIAVAAMNPATAVDPPAPAAKTPDWEKQGPFEFIASLIRADERGVKRIVVGDAPKDWLKKEHIEMLVGLLDSKEPCASVGSDRSSKRDFGGKYDKTSTVGHEAAYLIEGYRHGLYPKWAAETSADVEMDIAAIRKWWAEEKKR